MFIDVGEIRIYRETIFTKKGGKGVAEFGADLQQAGKDIRKAAKIADVYGKKLVVYTGYHGSPGPSMEFGIKASPGRFLREFDKAEKAGVKAYVEKMFTGVNIELRLIDVELTEQEIRNAIRNDFVFFAWCYSDALVGPMINQEKPISRIKRSQSQTRLLSF